MADAPFLSGRHFVQGAAVGAKPGFREWSWLIGNRCK